MNIDENNLEIMKLRKENAHVYKLPPMTSSKGHTVDDYTDLIFRGNMKITTKGDLCIVYFLNPDETVYLVSIINKDIDKYITQTQGSTRYFTLKAMSPQGEPGLYGVVFKQRNDAFDFYGTIVQYKEKLEIEEKLNKGGEVKTKYEFKGNMEGVNFTSSIENSNLKEINNNDSNSKNENNLQIKSNTVKANNADGLKK